jgi:hypothetical protein
MITCNFRNIIKTELGTNELAQLMNSEIDQILTLTKVKRRETGDGTCYQRTVSTPREPDANMLEALHVAVCVETAYNLVGGYQPVEGNC